MVLILLGVPLVAGWLIQRAAPQIVPRIQPLALCGLLFTIVALFALQGDAITVASNDFELAFAVAAGVFGATSGQALAGVVGPPAAAEA